MRSDLSTSEFQTKDPDCAPDVTPATSSAPPHPHTLAPQPAQIPHELTLLPQWVNWRWSWEVDQKGVGSWKKPPIDPATGKRIDAHVSANWRSFDAALTASTRADGVGFVLTADDPYVGIDLDHCVDPQGCVENWAQTIVDRFKSYTEFSPSGTGIRIMLWGVLPLGRKQKNGLGRDQTGKLECYDTKRFFTLTGHVLSGFETIKSTQAELTRWHAETFGAEREKATVRRADVTQDERTVLERARRNHKFDALYSGDLSAYGDDHSDADLGFCTMLANVGATAEQIDALMRSSGLMREKWNRADYRVRTLNKALDDRSPNVSTTAPQVGGETSCAAQLAALMRECDELKRALTGAQTRIQKQERDLKQLRAVQSDMIGILGNKVLGQRRLTALALAFDFAHRESAGDPGDGNGLYPDSRDRIGKLVGITPDTVTDHTKWLKERGLVRKQVVWLPESVDQTTGEIVPKHREMRIGSVGDAASFAHAAATFTGKASNWGGKREQCPRCGSEQRVTSCAECGLVLATSPKRQDDALMVAASSNAQDDRLSAESPPKRHLDASIDVLPHRGGGRESLKRQDDVLRQSLVSRAQHTTRQPAQNVVFQAEKRATVHAPGDTDYSDYSPTTPRPPALLLPPTPVGSPGDDQWTR